MQVIIDDSSRLTVCTHLSFAYVYSQKEWIFFLEGLNVTVLSHESVCFFRLQYDPFQF